MGVVDCELVKLLCKDGVKNRKEKAKKRVKTKQKRCGRV